MAKNNKKILAARAAAAVPGPRASEVDAVLSRALHRQLLVVSATRETHASAAREVPIVAPVVDPAPPAQHSSRGAGLVTAAPQPGRTPSLQSDGRPVSAARQVAAGTIPLQVEQRQKRPVRVILNCGPHLYPLF